MLPTIVKTVAIDFFSDFHHFMVCYVEMLNVYLKYPYNMIYLLLNVYIFILMSKLSINSNFLFSWSHFWIQLTPIPNESCLLLWTS